MNDWPYLQNLYIHKTSIIIMKITIKIIKNDEKKTTIHPDDNNHSISHFGFIEGKGFPFRNNCDFIIHLSQFVFPSSLPFGRWPKCPIFLEMIPSLFELESLQISEILLASKTTYNEINPIKWELWAFLVVDEVTANADDSPVRICMQKYSTRFDCIYKGCCRINLPLIMCNEIVTGALLDGVQE